MPRPIEKLESAIQSAVQNVVSLFKKVFGDAPKASLIAAQSRIDQINHSLYEQNHGLRHGNKPNMPSPSRRP